MGYLGNITNTVIEHFRDSVPCFRRSDIWFDVNSEPLNWQLPVGVLFDLYGGSTPSPQLPWHLAVHFQAFPFAKLVRGQGAEAVESHYFHSLKQGLFLEHGSSGPAMALAKDDQQALWEAVASGDKVAFASVDRNLRRRGSNLPSAVPVRLVLGSSDGGRSGPCIVHQPLCRSHLSTPASVGTTAISGKGSTGDDLTLGDFIAAHVAAAFVDSDGGGDDDCRGAAGMTLPPLPSISPGIRAVCHGVEMDLGAPLLDTWAMLQHPDHFLYIAVLPPAAPSQQRSGSFPPPPPPQALLNSLARGP